MLLKGSLLTGKVVGSLCSSRSSSSSTRVQWAQLEEGQNLEKNPWKEGVGHPCTHPDSSTFPRLLQWCGDNKALAHGRCVHELIITCGINQGSFLDFLLLQMYGNCSALEDALKLFSNMDQKDLASWNFIIGFLARQGQGQEVLQQYARMRQEGIFPNRNTFMTILSVCGDHAAISEGKQVHVLIMEIGCKTDVVVGTALVNMYGKCGGLPEARTLFNIMPLRNVVTWTAMISVCAQHCQGNEALHLFEEMLQERVEPDRVTFVNVLAACSSQVMLVEGQQMHAWVIIHGLEQDISIVNALINLYGKCGSLGDAQKVFNSIQVWDIISWTSLITAYAEHGECSKTSSLFEQMQREGFSPNKVTFVSVLAVFACQEALAAGEHIHNCIIQKGFDNDVIISNSLINMYNKCGSVENARRTFDRMLDRNVISWTSIIGMHAQRGQGKEALEAFEHMQREGLVPNRVTFTSVLEACASQGALVEGKYVHACIIGRRFECDLVVGTSLVKMYGLCGSVKDAQSVFDQMVERDVLTWNTIVAVYADHGHGNIALQLFDLMQGEGILPNEATYGFLLVACANQESISHGKQMHARAQGSECEPNVIMATNIVNMYGKCGSPEKSRRLFDTMVVKNIVSWTAMIAAYAENGQGKRALQLYAQILQECILPNKVTLISVIMACASQSSMIEGKRVHAFILHCGFRSETALGNALISMYGKCGSLKDAWQTFDSMHEKNVVSWSGMIAVCAQLNQGMAALQLFEQMQLKGVFPNEITFVSVLDACASQTCLVEGERMHAFILDNRLELSILVGNAMVNMYGKCGNLEDAWRIFESMAERDTTTWNLMIGAYAEHGQGKEALQLVEQMMQDGLTPDQATFVNLLSACSHSGLVDDGWHCFTSMIQEKHLTPDHCACLIDLFGRAGLLDAAEILINHIPFQPTIMSFMALLGACRYQVDISRGEHAARHVLELDAKSTAPLYMLKHIYTLVGSIDEAGKASRRFMFYEGGHVRPS